MLLFEPLPGVGELPRRVLVLALVGGGRAELAVAVAVVIGADGGELGRRAPVQELLLQPLVQRARLLELALSGAAVLGSG